MMDIPHDEENCTTGFGFLKVENNSYTGYSLHYNGAMKMLENDHTWHCDSIVDDTNKTSQTLLGYCYNFLPVQNYVGSLASYRFNTTDTIDKITGWTNFSGNVTVFNVAKDVKLLEAFRLGAQLAVACMAFTFTEF